MTKVLYVDPETDRPIVEVEQMRSGGKTFTVTSNWVRASVGAVSRLEAKPAIPSGYRESRSS